MTNPRAEHCVSGKATLHDLDDAELVVLLDMFCLTDEQTEDVKAHIINRFVTDRRSRLAWENHGGCDDEADDDWLYSADSDPYDKDTDLP